MFRFEDYCVKCCYIFTIADYTIVLAFVQFIVVSINKQL